MTALMNEPGKGVAVDAIGPGATGRSPLFGAGTEAARTAREVDWAAGPLGPVDHWPDTLRAAVQVVMSAPIPMSVLWGPELIQIYNDEYRKVIGNKHPAAMGESAADSWAEAWPQIGPILTSVAGGGGAVSRDDLMLLIDRKGESEETHWSFSYSPWAGPGGEPEGVLAVAHETTARVFQQGRLSTLHELALVGFTPTTSAQACRQAVAVLRRDRLDVPFAAVYLADSTGYLRRQAGYGASRASYWLPAEIEPGSTHPYARALSEGGAVHAHTSVVGGKLHAGPAGPVRPGSITSVPLKASHGEVIGVMVWAANPYRPLDENYDHFLHLVSEHVAAARGERSLLPTRSSVPRSWPGSTPRRRGSTRTPATNSARR